jgi:hypothetical protein
MQQALLLLPLQEQQRSARCRSADVYNAQAAECDAVLYVHAATCTQSPCTQTPQGSYKLKTSVHLEPNGT